MSFPVSLRALRPARSHPVGFGGQFLKPFLAMLPSMVEDPVWISSVVSKSASFNSCTLKVHFRLQLDFLFYRGLLLFCLNN